MIEKNLNWSPFVNNIHTEINDYSFIHLGGCIHVDVIKEFLQEHNVSYKEQ